MILVIVPLQANCSKIVARDSVTAANGLGYTRWKSCSKSSWKTIHVKMHSTYRLADQTYFHMKGFAWELFLKQRYKVTRKWPISISQGQKHVDYVMCYFFSSYFCTTAWPSSEILLWSSCCHNSIPEKKKTTSNLKISKIKMLLNGFKNS